MIRFFTATAFICLLSSCGNNENTATSTQHHTDSSTHHMPADSMPADSLPANPMKLLMDKMMVNMHQQKITGNIDVDYANMMLQHHQGAVDMASLQESQGSNVVLKEFSRKVIKDQQEEIAVMAAFIASTTRRDTSNAAAFKMAMDASMQTMMNAAVKIYNTTDEDFVAQMIPHHQSAVDMAKAYLQYGNEPSLKKLSEDIIRSQQKEIEWLKEWLAKR